MRLILLAVLMAICSVVANAQLTSHYQAASGGHPGIGFYDFKPKDYTTDPSKKLPMIIALHGQGERGNGQSELDKVFTSGIGYLVKHGATMQFNYENNVKGSFVVMLPQLDGQYSNWQPFYLDAMVTWAKANLNIDPNRIFITGYSLGGGGTWVYPAQSVASANNIAGLIPVSGSGLPSGDPCNIAKGGVAVWAIHTSDDDQVPTGNTQAVVNAIKACGPTEPIVGWYPKGNHQIYDQKIYPDTNNRYSYPTVYQWMLRVNRANTPANNVAPVANVGATDTTVIATPTLFFQKTITGVLSYDPNDVIVHYNWECIGGDKTKIFPFNGYQPVDFTNTAWPATDLDYKNLSWPVQNFEFHALGDYTFRLTVTDMYGAVTTQTKTIHITNNGKNTAPYVGLGNDITLASNATNPAATTANFNGTRVFDWEGQNMTYAVTQVSGPKAAKLNVTNWYQFIASDMTVAGNYKFRVTATDAGGAVGSDEVIVTKLPDSGTIPPVAKITGPTSVTLPTNSITLSGATSTGSIVKYEWFQSSGPNTSTIVSPNGSSTVINNLIAGTYRFMLRVTDGQQGSDTVNTTVVVSPAANVLPVAKITGPTSITLPTNSITLSGTGSTDSDGSITKYEWSQASGPNTSAIVSPAGSSTVINNLIAGTYKFLLKVTDNQTATDTVYATLVVNPAPNVPPVAKITGPTSITLPTNLITLSGTGSTDGDGSITKYAWTQVLGPNTAAIVSPAGSSTVVNGLIAGTYRFLLTVTDNQLATDTVYATLVVNPAPNVPPVAKITGPTSITLPTNSITLNGNTSTDSDGSITKYEWSQSGGPNTSAIVSPAGISTVINGLVAGTYVFQLKVTDNSLATAATTITVVVNPAPNVPPVAKITGPTTITLPTNSITLNGNTSTDSDGSITKYQWSQQSGPNAPSIVSPAGVSTVINNLVVGTYVFRLVVTDNQLAVDTGTITVIVNPANNVPPVAKITGPTSVTLPTNTITLNGNTSTDSDGNITKYEWSQSSGPNTSAIVSPTGISTVINSLVAGTYVFQLKVTDNSLATAIATISVVVNPAANVPPVAKITGTTTITLPVNTTTLSGSTSTDSDGSITKYEWTQTGGPNTAAIVSPAGQSTVINNLTAGSYSFQLKVTDNQLATGTTTVIVTVNPANNVPPVAKITGPTSITLPVNSITLDGSTSTDSDGSIVSYTWTQTSGPNTSTFVTPTAKSTIINNMIAGTYGYQLWVTDNKGGTGIASTTVVVNPPVQNNKPPVANAGNDFVTATNYAYLSAGGSYDPDGKIALYSWTQVSGPNTATILAGNTMFPTVQSLVSGVYTFRVTVTDNNGASASDDVQLTVGSNKPPIANAGSDFTTTNDFAYLSGAASSDPDGSIASYKWTQVNGPNTAGIVDGTTSFPTVQNLVPGVYVFRLSVTDNNGAGASDDVQVTVLANKPPIANAGSDFATANTFAYLSGAASSDPDGSIASYKWAQVSGPNTAVIVDGNTSFPTVQGLATGVYVFRLTVTDNDGATASDDVQVTAGSNKLPVANAGNDFSTTNNYAYLSAGASYDPDGKISAFSWTQVTGPNTAGVLGGTTMFPTVQGLIPGTYTFRLKVTDNVGASATDDVVLTVTAKLVAGGVSTQSAVVARDLAATTPDIKLSVYPNPAASKITLTYANNYVGSYKVVIYDVKGKPEAQYSFKKLNAGAAQEQLDISKLPAGMHYIETIYEGNQQSAVQKFIKL